MIEKLRISVAVVTKEIAYFMRQPKSPDLENFAKLTLKRAPNLSGGGWARRAAGETRSRNKHVFCFACPRTVKYITTRRVIYEPVRRPYVILSIFVWTQ